LKTETGEVDGVGGGRWVEGMRCLGREMGRGGKWLKEEDGLGESEGLGE